MASCNLKHSCAEETLLEARNSHASFGWTREAAASGGGRSRAWASGHLSSVPAVQVLASWAPLQKNETGHTDPLGACRPVRRLCTAVSRWGLVLSPASAHQEVDDDGDEWDSDSDVICRGTPAMQASLASLNTSGHHYPHTAHHWPPNCYCLWNPCMLTHCGLSMPQKATSSLQSTTPRLRLDPQWGLRWFVWCQPDWTTGHADIWLSIISRGVCSSVFR